MTERIDNESRWVKQQELDELDYKKGYGAFLDNDPDQYSESPAWKRGWEDAKADFESKRSSPKDVLGTSAAPTTKNGDV